MAVRVTPVAFPSFHSTQRFATQLTGSALGARLTLGQVERKHELGIGNLGVEV